MIYIYDMWMFFGICIILAAYLPELKACVPHHIMKRPAKELLALPIVILAFWPLNPVLGFNIIAPTKPRKNRKSGENSNTNVFIRANLKILQPNAQLLIQLHPLHQDISKIQYLTTSNVQARQRSKDPNIYLIECRA